jgi:t-SNARE complex subunit (syntaxin)
MYVLFTETVFCYIRVQMLHFVMQHVCTGDTGELSLGEGRKQVGKAVDHVASGTQQLQRAKNNQRATSKCIAIAIILMLLAILIIVLVVIQPWKTTT